MGASQKREIFQYFQEENLLNSLQKPEHHPQNRPIKTCHSYKSIQEKILNFQLTSEEKLDTYRLDSLTSKKEFEPNLTNRINFKTPQSQP